MATLLGLLIVVAALGAIISAALKSQKSYFVPLSGQLYESSDSWMEAGSRAMSIPDDFLPMMGEPVLPERQKPSLLKPVAYTLGICFTAYAFAQTSPAGLADMVKSAFNRKPDDTVSGVYPVPRPKNKTKSTINPVQPNLPAENQEIYLPDDAPRPVLYAVDSAAPQAKKTLLHKKTYSVLKLQDYAAPDGAIALREMLENDLIYALKVGPEEYWACIFFESDAAATDAETFWKKQRKTWEQYGIEPTVINLAGRCRSIVQEEGTVLCRCAR